MDIVDKLKAQAAEIADEGHNGWGNTMTEAAEKIESLKAQKEPVAEVPCSGGFFCRVRNEGETMRNGDIVLISDTFRPLGFHTEFYHYFVGLKVVDGMTGKIICKAT
ncbi:hypothetical protein KAR91_33290 [Candidatus Pacearchaeota archaeon]|nr:hypothetical protein [Candidatus Pacearchaeota archaeon]